MNGYSRALKRFIKENRLGDRLPRLEIMPYHQDTLKRWYDEGLPEKVKTLSELHDYFGLTPLHFHPCNTEIDRLTLEGPLGSKEVYRSVLHEIYDRDMIDASLEEYQRAHEAMEKHDGILWVCLQGFFWHPRQIIGIAEHLMAFYDQPDLLLEIQDHLLEYNVSVLEGISKIGAPTIICVSEDMAYKQGSMISKEHFDRFLKPYHQRLVQAASGLDCILSVDSDGDISQISSWFSDLGYHCMSPFERQCDQRFSRIRETSPELGILGGYDKRVIASGQQAIEQEFSHATECFVTGRYLPAVDHQTPPETSLKDYRLYLAAQASWFDQQGIL